MQRAFAKEDQFLEYFPDAEGSPDILLASLQLDASNMVESVAPLPHVKTALGEAVTTSSTRILVHDLGSLPDSGVLHVGDERIEYDSRTATDGVGYLETLTRGAYNSRPSSHLLDAPVTATPRDYADRRVRAEMRAFAFLAETQGFVHTERIQGVSSTRYVSQVNVRNLLRSIMGKTARRTAAPIR